MNISIYLSMNIEYLYLQERACSCEVFVYSDSTLVLGEAGTLEVSRFVQSIRRDAFPGTK